MYLLLTLLSLYISVEAEPCITPYGVKGECVPLKLCPSLLQHVTNYKWGIHEYIKNFICSNDELGLMVCCHSTIDYIVFEDEEHPKQIQNVKFENHKDCGISNLEISDEVVRLQDFPWLVKIIIINNTYVDYENEPDKVVCTGVLISDRYILYSAYCDKSVLQPTNLNYYIRIDSYVDNEMGCNKKSYSEKCRDFEMFEPDRYVVHNFYDSKTKLNNIAVLMLNRRIHFSDFVRPICLPESDYSITSGETLYTAGWNRTYSLSDISVKILQSSVYVPNLECENRLLKNNLNFSLSSYEMCTSNKKNNIDKRIIGLPLMSLKGNRWYLQGFESYGENIKVNTRVQNYTQWVQEAMGKERCSVPFNNLTGECLHIGYCPRTFNLLANLSPKDEIPLSIFRCGYGSETASDRTYVLKVCCAFTPELTVFPETASEDLQFEVSNFKFCGLQHRDDYISTDHSLAIDEFPWLAIILNATLPDQRDKVCSGSLITHRYVLSSGKCNTQFNSDDTVLVRLGDYNLKNSSDCVEFSQFGSIDCNEIQEYGVEKTIIHTFFNRYTLYNDIALLRLNVTVTFSNYVRPICVPRSENDMAKPGAILFTTGFGDFDVYGRKNQAKKKILTTLMTNKECQLRYKMQTFMTLVTPYQICTEDIQNITEVACNGDEGGPVMYSSKKSQWFIQGISSTYGCGKPGLPQKFTNVYKYLKWIKLNIKQFD